MMLTPDNATLVRTGSNLPAAKLTVSHSDEFNCQLAVLEASMGIPAANEDAVVSNFSEPKPGLDDNRLAANFVLALSKARLRSAPSTDKLETLTDASS
jgi:hypothetical protein